MSRIVTIASGIKGVGRTYLCVQLGLELAARGRRTALLDTDPGPENIDSLLALPPRYTLGDVLADRADVADMVARASGGLDVISVRTGGEQLLGLDADHVQRLTETFIRHDEYDFVLVDASAGTPRDVIAYALASSDVLLVVTPLTASQTEAYALLRILYLNGYEGRVLVIVNQAGDEQSAAEIYERFRSVVRRYLFVDVPLLGSVTREPELVSMVRAEQARLSLLQESGASPAVAMLARRLAELSPGGSTLTSLGEFWPVFVRQINTPLAVTGRITVARARGDDAGAPEPREASLETDVSGRGLHLAEAALPVDALYPVAQHLASALGSVSDVLTQVCAPAAGAQDLPRGGGDAGQARSRAHLDPVLGSLLSNLLQRLADVVEKDAVIRLTLDCSDIEPGTQDILPAGEYISMGLYCQATTDLREELTRLFDGCTAVRGAKDHEDAMAWRCVSEDGEACIEVEYRTGIALQLVCRFRPACEEGGASSPGADRNGERTARSPGSDDRAARDIAATVLAGYDYRTLQEPGDGVTHTLYEVRRRDGTTLLCAFNEEVTPRNGAGGDS